jgi:hypothetical protein
MKICITPEIKKALSMEVKDYQLSLDKQKLDPKTILLNNTIRNCTMSDKKIQSLLFQG